MTRENDPKKMRTFFYQHHLKSFSVEKEPKKKKEMKTVCQIMGFMCVTFEKTSQKFKIFGFSFSFFHSFILFFSFLMSDSTYSAVHRPEGFQFPLSEKWKIEELSDDGLFCFVLFCFVLFCFVLFCFVLCCVVLCCVVLCCVFSFFNLFLSFF